MSVQRRCSKTPTQIELKKKEKVLEKTAALLGEEQGKCDISSRSRGHAFLNNTYSRI